MKKRTANNTQDIRKTPEQLYGERAKRFQDAFELKQPDAIPIVLPMSFMLAETSGITKQELLENSEKAQELLEEAAIEYQPDSIFGPFLSDPRPFLLLGDRMTTWPGHGVEPNSEFQFVESDYMKAEDYDEFLEDPADWAIRVYLPRVCRALEGFSMLPPLGMWLSGSYNLMNSVVLTAPPLAASLQAFAKAAQMVAESTSRAARNAERMVALGFVPTILLPSALIEAPFDLMSDTLRGMRGIMLDILQRPEKLLAAEEKVSHFLVKFAIDFCRSSGVTRAFLPLHRGSDGFMSIKQFEKFYWPQLKNMLLVLIEHGIMPIVFYEGVWNQRLGHLTELPKGKTVGWFQASDISKVKEVVGDTMCIMGGMPNSMLQAGAVEQVREHTRKVCQTVGKGGGFIMCTGVGEMSGSKPELVKAWVDATREYGVY